MNIIFADLQERHHHLPLTFTRHSASLRVGINTLAEKWKMMLKGDFSYLATDYLQALYSLRIAGENLLINPLALPSKSLLNAIHYLDAGSTLEQNGQWLAARLSADEVAQYRETGAMPGDSVHFDEELRYLAFPWVLFSENATEIATDYAAITKGRKSAQAHESCTLLGNDIFIEEGAEVVNCSLNAMSGPIYIGKGAKVLDGAFIRGPFALCENATVNMGAKIRDASTVGPHCKVGGEINNSILMGYSNKGHDGFMGNSVIGEWCNLGADTNVSNLKNNYGNIKTWQYKSERYYDTKRQFCGLIMGDHSKCGINTMFNTGTVVGVSANIFGADFPPKFIPSFSWGGKQGMLTYDFDKACETAQRMMERRGKSLSHEARAVLKEVFDFDEQYRNQEI